MEARRDERWRLLVPPGAICLDVPRSKANRDLLRDRVLGLPSGTAVVLRDSAPVSRLRCRRFAAATAVQIQREYLALPSASPAFVVQDRPESVRFFFTTAVTVPSGITRFVGPATGLLWLLSLLAPWSLVGALVPGRLTVGRRV